MARHGWDLDELVAGLRAVRESACDAPEAFETGERPSRDVVVELVKNLRAALFPSHFGLSDFTRRGIDYFVGERLEVSLRTLEEQVRRALVCTCSGPSRPSGEVGEEARRITSEFSRRLPEVRALLEEDLRAADDGDPAARSRTEVLLCYPGVSAMLHHRLAHELYLLEVPLLPRIISELSHAATGIDIHPGARIGRRFFIDHGTGVVIGETAVIGERVRLYQGVTLGAKSFPRGESGALIKGQPRHPIIGDDVVIYAGATVLGRITIGAGSTIGGNVWVTTSLPPGSHVNQARVRFEEILDGGAGI